MCRSFVGSPTNAPRQAVNNLFISKVLLNVMAESEGFEPPIALRLCLISSQVHSTGLCQLSAVSRCGQTICPGSTDRAFPCAKRRLRPDDSGSLSASRSQSSKDQGPRGSLDRAVLPDGGLSARSHASVPAKAVSVQSRFETASNSKWGGTCVETWQSVWI